MLIGILKMKIKWNNKKEIYSYVKTLDHHKVFTLNSWDTYYIIDELTFIEDHEFIILI